MFKKLEKTFDADGDGSITMEEFRFGIKGFGMKVALESEIGFEAPHYWTLAQWTAEIQAVLNKSVAAETAQLSGWFAGFDGKKSAMRAQSNAAERAKDPTLLVIYQSKEANAQLKKLFDLMDKDGNGSLEAADFAIMSKNPATASFWDELKSNFDGDGDESVTFEEFCVRVSGTVTERISVGSIPRKDWTWRQVIARLTEWGNWMVQEQCREIHDYFKYGEFESKTPEDLEKGEEFGCGMHLGAPAFPGGEPKDNGNKSSLASTFAHDGSSSAPSTFQDAGHIISAPQGAAPAAAAAPAASPYGPAGPSTANAAMAAYANPVVGPYYGQPAPPSAHSAPPPHPPQAGGRAPTVIYIY